MEPFDQSRAYRVEARDQAAALDHPLRSRLLMACARHERSLIELSRELGEPLSKLHYHLKRMLAAGLLEVARLEPRAGRPVRHYRAIAEAFLLSLADVAEPIGEQMARQLRLSLAQEANRRELSLLYHLDEAGRYRVRLVDHGGRGRTPNAFEYWKVLRLTTEQRRTLAAELAEVVSRYEAAPAPEGGQPFLVHAAFAPKP